MSKFSLPNLLKASGKRMREDLAERLVPHPGELGVAREEIIRQFLRAYLPKRFEISSGFTFDSKGNVSRQLDIVISNSLVCPRFETKGGTRFYPCESVVAGSIFSRRGLGQRTCGSPLQTVHHRI